MAKRKKRALITGITGQDGSYLAEFLLKKNYQVYGVVSDLSNSNYPNISEIQDKLTLLYGDLLDYSSIERAVEKSKPHEVYNLASQSIPSTSFQQPMHTTQVTGVGAQRVFEAVKKISPKARVYQASSAEMYGWVDQTPQNENTPFNPANPYAAAKLYAHNVANIYKESFDLFIVCGIAFNHSSPRRPLNFVEQKAAYAAACLSRGIKTSKKLNEKGKPIVYKSMVHMGNLKAKRDWGYAGDYVEAMWLILQQKKADNFVIGTGEAYTIEELCKEAFSYVGLNYKKHIVSKKDFIRPTETSALLADITKAKRKLSWKPRVKFRKLVRILVDNQLKLLASV